MKYIPLLPFSLLNLTLNAVAVITASILPGKEAKIFSAGHIEISSLSGVSNIQCTCKDGYQVNVQHCDFTATNGDDSTTTVGTANPNPNTSDNVDVNNTTGVIGSNTGTIPTAAGLLGTWVSSLH